MAEFFESPMRPPWPDGNFARADVAVDWERPTRWFYEIVRALEVETRSTAAVKDMPLVPLREPDLEDLAFEILREARVRDEIRQQLKNPPHLP
jgi:hypothetical protein